MKRAFDIFFSIVGLVFLSPVFVISALAVKRGSRGPVFYKQVRMGRGFKPFSILKFRTMVVDADKKGSLITSGGDSRITGIGRILRKTKLDELPQLINVLKGEMSFVGPRPEVKKYVDLFREDYKKVLSVRPGITDIASLRFQDEEGMLASQSDPDKYYREVHLPIKIKYAEEYIRRSSVHFDVWIILLTIMKIFYKGPDNQGEIKAEEHGQNIKPSLNNINTMKILNLISSSGLFGAERVALELAVTLRDSLGETPIMGVIKNNHSPHTEVGEEAKRLGLETKVFDCGGQFDRKTISAIRQYIRENGIDLVHCHGYKSNFYGYFASRGLVPTVATNHNWLRSNWRLRLYCFIDSHLIRHFDSVVGVSEDISADMEAHGVPAEKIIVIDNGVNMSRFKDKTKAASIRKELGIAKDTVIIGTAGSLKCVKGHTFLLQAAVKVLRSCNKEVKLLIVGDGELREELEAEARGLGIEDNVIFTGYRTDVEDVLRSLDLFVLPSLREGLPMVLLEAMASRKPVVASRVGAIPKVVEGTECGQLVEPGDADALAATLTALIKNKKKMRLMGERGYEKVLEDYSSEKMARKYLAIYTGLTGETAHIRQAVGA